MLIPIKDLSTDIVLVDGAGYIFRSFYSIPMMMDINGMPLNAVYGFIRMLMQFVNYKRKSRCLAVVFDAARRTFRNDLYPSYKANRPPLPNSLTLQFPLIREAVRAFNITSLEREGYEADDLIATYARTATQQGKSVAIFSSDKDLMQLIAPNITLWNPLKNHPVELEQVREKFGVDPEKVIEVQALAGDSSDNIPGVPGIGIKTASMLINHFGNLECLLTHIQEVQKPKLRQALVDYADMARLSYKLARLKDDVPVTIPLTGLGGKPIEPLKVRAFLQEKHFYSLQTLFEKLYN